MSTSKKSKRQQARIKLESEKLLSCALPRAIIKPYGTILVAHPAICDCCAPKVVAEAQRLLKGFGYANLLEFVPSEDSGGAS